MRLEAAGRHRDQPWSDPEHLDACLAAGLVDAQRLIVASGRRQRPSSRPQG